MKKYIEPNTKFIVADQALMASASADTPNDPKIGDLPVSTDHETNMQFSNGVVFNY